MLADRPNSLVAADSAAIATYLPAYEIVHAIPGRFRLRIPQLNWDEDYATRLEWLVGHLTGVAEARVNSAAKSLIVSYDATEISPRKLQNHIVACLKDATNSELSTEITIADAPEELGEIDYVERLGMPGLSLLLSLGAIAGMPVPIWLLAGVIIAGSVPAFLRAWEGIEEEGELNVDFLDSLAIVLHTIEGRFFPPAFMLGLLESGEVIRDLTARGTARANLDLLDCLGKTARVERDGDTQEIPLKEVVVGDIVVVFPGDQIPIDGNIRSGTATIDQQKLTGESVPVTRDVGDEVFASTLVVDGTLRIEVERTGENTRAGVVVALMKAAPVHDTRIENYAQKIGNQAVLPTLFLGGAVWAATGSAARGISLITLDFGTGIRVSVPTAILSALTYAARQGVFIRSGRAIEMLARVDTIVFDKTGTLTQGHAEVVEVCSIDRDYSEADVLALAATAEQGLTHPVAEAIVRHAAENGVDHRECEDWDYLVGYGISARIDKRPVFVGSGSLMRKQNIKLDGLHRRHPEILSGGNSMVYVATDREVIGAILYRDPPRPESHLVIADLHREGIEPYMLSGDVQPVAEAIASELGIESHNVYAGAFPERKVEVVKGLSESGKTIAFVGDGINDSAALAHADVSISFASATDMARETADIVLMDDNIASLILAIRIAKQTMDVVWQNTAVVAVPNLSAMLFGVFFILDPVLAVAINNGSAIVAELNGLRPLLGPDNVPDFVKDPTIVGKPSKAQAIAPAASKPKPKPDKPKSSPKPQKSSTAKSGRKSTKAEKKSETKGFSNSSKPDEPTTFEDLRVG
ncbi:MAG: heavy metal translocating P-type ATPase [Geitlerinemataceae cyanobacterium]